MINLRFFASVWAFVLLSVSVAAVPARGQEKAPAEATSTEMSRELHRAELAWRSGGSLLEAKARVDRVLAHQPNNIAALKLRAHVLLGMGRPDQALLDARRAAETPADAEALLLVAESARLSGYPDEARAALDLVAGLAFNNAELHVRLAWNAAELGRLERAEAFVRIALQQDPALPGAYIQLARIFVMQRERDAAASVLVRGLTLGVLDTQSIAEDERLRPLLQHPDVQALLRK